MQVCYASQLHSAVIDSISTLSLLLPRVVKTNWSLRFEIKVVDEEVVSDLHSIARNFQLLFNEFINLLGVTFLL